MTQDDTTIALLQQKIKQHNDQEFLMLTPTRYKFIKTLQREVLFLAQQLKPYDPFYMQQLKNFDLRMYNSAFSYSHTDDDKIYYVLQTKEIEP